MSDLEKLIAKLEAATEGSRELDAFIHRERHPELADMIADHPSAAPGWLVGGNHENPVTAPHYTTSLDAALTLVPEGWEWLASNRARTPHTGRAYIHNRELVFGGIGHLSTNPKYRGEETTAATPALATCIAALRARQP